ncbi:uncharacterized protein [Antedon mediterranea]|uniref:uncharacterized protein n=1 Tax=Antedon mediterranea TaxID=105859 RepID=UPI003AF92FF3
MPDKELLKDQVVLIPDSLVKVLTRFVTVVPSKPVTFRKAYRQLDKGILEEDLLRNFFEECKVDVDVLKKFELLVELMIQLGFICEMKTTSSPDVASTSTGSITKRSFFVPLRLAFKTSSEVKQEPDDSQSISIYYDFEGYLPDVLFPYVIVECLNKFQLEGFEPKLSCNHCKLYLDQFHHVTVSLVQFTTKEDKQKFLLKMTVKRTNSFKQTNDEKCEPSSEACQKVLSTVEKTFKQSKDGGRRGIPFKRCIPCDCSLTSEKKHFQILPNFQYERLPCNEDDKILNTNVERYKLLFGGNSSDKIHY